MSINVKLLEKELESSKLLGEKRFTESRKMGLKNKQLNYKPYFDYLGAAGEMAVAKGLSLKFIETCNSFKAADVGMNIQVRTTEYKNGRLIVHSNDNPMDLYILCIASMPYFTVVGWCYGYECFEKGFEKDGNMWVDQYKLRPIETIFDNEDFKLNLKDYRN